MEEWRAVRENHVYEVSDSGRARTITREVAIRTGGTRLLKGVYLKPSVNSTDRLTVTVYVGGIPKRRSIHRLVCEAFHGPAPADKPWALHRNGDHRDNRAENLYWGSPQDNVDDMIRHGTHWESAQNTCRKGHKKDGENWYPRPDGNGGECRICIKARSKRARATPPPEGDPLHGRPATYTGRGCRCEICKSAYKEYRSKFKNVVLADGDYRHGITGSTIYSCKCDICLRESRAHYKRQRERRKTES